MHRNEYFALFVVIGGFIAGVSILKLMLGIPISSQVWFFNVMAISALAILMLWNQYYTNKRESIMVKTK